MAGPHSSPSSGKNGTPAIQVAPAVADGIGEYPPVPAQPTLSHADKITVAIRPTNPFRRVLTLMADRAQRSDQDDDDDGDQNNQQDRENGPEHVVNAAGKQLVDLGSQQMKLGVG